MSEDAKLHGVLSTRGEAAVIGLLLPSNKFIILDKEYTVDLPKGETKIIILGEKPRKLLIQYLGFFELQRDRIKLTGLFVNDRVFVKCVEIDIVIIHMYIMHTDIRSKRICQILE